MAEWRCWPSTRTAAGGGRCEPVFSSFSRHVVHLSEADAGQTARLFNNALLMMNQAGIAKIVDLVAELGVDQARLVKVLKFGSASSPALTLLNRMVTLDNVEHRSGVEALDMELRDAAMRDAGSPHAPCRPRRLRRPPSQPADGPPQRRPRAGRTAPGHRVAGESRTPAATAGNGKERQ
ncbi:NAD-binding protein [Nonomuraea jabiensis]|uniref:NAD-binding protein n=1 Tax=Nonomuraea jabiensis TaxID=882448 RepID=UPI003D75483D